MGTADAVPEPVEGRSLSLSKGSRPQKERSPFIVIKSQIRWIKTVINKLSNDKKEVSEMSAITITKDNFESEVLQSDKPVLLDCLASLCGPCRMVGPEIEEIAAERSDIKVGKINVDEQPELAAQFKVMSIPTLMVVKEGKVTNQSAGARPKAQILSLL